jgi:hypothetical protein
MNPKHNFKILLVTAFGVLALLALPSLAAAKDRNHDGIPDRWEKRHNLSLHINQAHRNQDHEGLNNLEEFENGTNPRNPDTDSDGLTDAQEVEVGDNPRSADSNHDGIPDGEDNAGKIASFDGTTLTLEQFDGSTVSGQVNESTEIECEHHAEVSDQVAGASDEGGDEQSGEQQSGEDDQAGEEQNSGEGDQGSGTCTVADLVPGALVREAELDVTPSGTVFHSVHLSG